MSESLGPNWQTPTEKRDETIEKIAQGYLGFTLKTQNSDSLDFHDTAVWSIRHVMALAYEAGRASKK